MNDMEFNITTISSMSCSNLRDLGSLVTGNPGFIDQRVASLSTLANYSCHNSSKGPTITLKLSFLADLGGLYCISIGIFFYLLIQCEYRIKKLRNEDSILRRIRNQHKAREHWDKLRKYVMYTYGYNTGDDIYKNSKMESSCSGLMLQPLRGSGSSRKRRQQSRTDSISSYRKAGGTATKSLSCKPLESTNDQEKHSEKVSKQQSVGSSKETAQSQPQESSFIDNFIPPPPSLEFKSDSEMDMSDVKKNLKRLHEYNVMLREKLVAGRAQLHSTSSRHSSQVNRNEGEV